MEDKNEQPISGSTGEVKSDKTKARGKNPALTIFGVVAITLSVVAYSHLRSSGIRGQLKSCENTEVVNADVYYDGLFGKDSIVFSLANEHTPSTRRIDPVHLLMQFATRVDYNSVRRVVLTRKKKKIFYITGEKLKRLADSYEGGGRIWAFNNLPESVRRMDGSQPYSEWTGGLLGVTQKQAEDLNELIKEWTGY